MSGFEILWLNYVQIITFLDIKSLIRISMASHLWREMALSEVHWRSAYFQRWHSFPLQGHNDRTWKETFKMRYRVEQELLNVQSVKSDATHFRV